MPYTNPRLERLYGSTIAPSIKAARPLEPKRADRSVEAKIVDYIWQLLNEAHVVVAVTSGDNPNVFYELGIAHTLGKPVVVLRDRATGEIPFNIRHLRQIPYSSSAAGHKRLRAELTRVLLEIVAEYPTGHRVLDDLEHISREWREPSREFGYLYSDEQLKLVRSLVPQSEVSDYAVAFCIASGCRNASSFHMVHWGLIANGR